MKKLIPPDANLIPAGATRVFEGVLYDVYQWEQEMFDGTYRSFEGVRRPDVVATVGVVDDSIIVVHDTQPHKGLRVGLPGGRIDAEDSSSLAAARREMREETGYEFADWKLVEVIKPESKIDCFVNLYVATNPTNTGQQNVDQGGERISVELADYDTVLSMLRRDYRQALGYVFLEKVGSLQELLVMPEFSGIEVDIPAK